MRAFLIVPACLLAAGCTTAPRTVPVPTNMAISIPCKAVQPDVPAWPTQTVPLDPLAPDFMDQFVKAATAEIELRIGYEARLLAELKSCL